MKNKTDRIDRRKARAWLVLKGIRLIDIQRAINFKHPTQIGETLRGIRSDKRVLQYILDQGCPERYLKLPDSIRRKEIL